MLFHILLNIIVALSLIGTILAAPLSPSEPLRWLTEFPEQVPADTTVRIHWTGGDGNGVAIHVISSEPGLKESVSVITSNTTTEWVEWKTPSFDLYSNQTFSLRIHDGSLIDGSITYLHSPPMRLVSASTPSYTSFMTFYADPISTEDAVHHLDSPSSMLSFPSPMFTGHEEAVEDSWGSEDLERQIHFMSSDEDW